jgi:hypothetical protein
VGAARYDVFPPGGLSFETAMSRPFSPDEPAREKLYRRLYVRTKLRLDHHDDVLMYLIERIDELQKRIEELERTYD